MNKTQFNKINKVFDIRIYNAQYKTYSRKFIEKNLR